MATLTVDGQSLSVDGRRMWMVSGTIHPSRIPSALWRSRIAAAKDAGLNCIEAPVVWSVHEVREGQFNFEGDRDIAGFVRLVGEAGMRCILRIGPFVGDGYDLGGLPSWLVPSVDWKVRTGSSEFLGACSRYLSALCDQVANLQVTVRRAGKGDGPIVMVQCEHEWFCGDDSDAEAYLGELTRYLRENGIVVPIVNRDNLFHQVEGHIDGWSGGEHLLATVRQLRVVRPGMPRMVMGLPAGAADAWGQERRSAWNPALLMRSMAEVLAGGGQFNLSPFAGGTAFGALAGRLDIGADAYSTTNADASGPLAQGGGRGALYQAVKRVCTFASSFERVLAGLEPDVQPVTIAPEATTGAVLDGVTGEQEKKRSSGGANMTVCHARGGQGSIAFVFADSEPGAKRRHHTTLLLSDGSSLPVDLGDEAVGWYLLKTHLRGRSTLDWTNLSAFTLIGRTLVLFGPAGTSGAVSINGSPMTVQVPKGQKPTVVEHEGIALVICSTAQIDASYVRGEAVYIGVSGFDAEGNPLSHPEYRLYTRVDGDGAVSSVTGGAVMSAGGKAQLRSWSVSVPKSHIDGSSERYARIAQPQSMERLGTPSGYGWLRVVMKQSGAKRCKAAFFESGDRLHVFHEGKFVDLVGRGPGAQPDFATLPLKKGENTITILVDNLGRFCEGNHLGEMKGVYGHIWEPVALKQGAPKQAHGALIDPITLRKPVFGLRHGELTEAARLEWTVQHRKKSPLLIAVDVDPAVQGMVVVILNDAPIGLIDSGQPGRFVVDSERLTRGNNTVGLAVVGSMEESAALLKKAVTIYEGASCLTEKAEWAFAKWETPRAETFESVTKATLSGKTGEAWRGAPAWWRAEILVEDTNEPLFFDATGLSKGHLYLNGHDVGRYFVGTADGKAVPPQTRYYLPEPWLKTNEANELLVFDEHGFAPGRCSLVYDAMG